MKFAPITIAFALASYCTVISADSDHSNNRLRNLSPLVQCTKSTSKKVKVSMIYNNFVWEDDEYIRIKLNGDEDYFPKRDTCDKVQYYTKDNAYYNDPYDDCHWDVDIEHGDTWRPYALCKTETMDVNAATEFKETPGNDKIKIQLYKAWKEDEGESYGEVELTHNRWCIPTDGTYQVWMLISGLGWEGTQLLTHGSVENCIAPFTTQIDLSDSPAKKLKYNSNAGGGTVPLPSEHTCSSAWYLQKWEKITQSKKPKSIMLVLTVENVADAWD